jgi:hypothetical protein
VGKHVANQGVTCELHSLPGAQADHAAHTYAQRAWGYSCGCSDQLHSALRLQTRLQAKGAQQSTALGVLRHVVATQGVTGLWRGAVPGMVGGGHCHRPCCERMPAWPGMYRTCSA